MSGPATADAQKVKGSDERARSTHYPRWARTLAHGIRARLGNTFVLHGNTHDLRAGAAGRRTPPARPRDFVPLTVVPGRTGSSASARW